VTASLVLWARILYLQPNNSVNTLHIQVGAKVVREFVVLLFSPISERLSSDLNGGIAGPTHQRRDQTMAERIVVKDGVKVAAPHPPVLGDQTVLNLYRLAVSFHYFEQGAGWLE
jgi:hypothetical protein